MAEAIRDAGPDRHRCRASAAPVAAITPFPVSETEHRLIGALPARSTFSAYLDDDAANPQEAVDRDSAVAASAEVPALRIWRNRRCVVASRRQANLPSFKAAKLVSEAAGWPVAVRRSAGTAVVHRPGVLNFSLVTRSAAPGAALAIGHDYEALLTVLRDMLAGLGIACDHGAVAGAHCDGRYNLRWRGRKLAGTAAYVTRGNGVVTRLFHASLLVGGSIGGDLEAIDRFEAALGEPAAYDPAAHVTVDEILNRQARFHPRATPQASRSASIC